MVISENEINFFSFYRLEESENLELQLEAKKYYDIGTKYQIYPYQDMEPGSTNATIILRTHYR